MPLNSKVLSTVLALTTPLCNTLSQTQRRIRRVDSHIREGAVSDDADAEGDALVMNAGQRRGVRARQELFPEFKVEEGYQSPLSAAARRVEDSVADDIHEQDLMAILKEVTELGPDDEPTRSFSNKDAVENAAEWIKKQFLEMGFEEDQVCLQRFEFEDHPEINVVALIDADAPGSVTVGAHYDSRPFTGPAPGANDNGSGTAAMLELAKVVKKNMASVKPQKPLYFVAFAAEEAGLYGSDHFAAALADPLDDSLPSNCRSKRAGDNPSDEAAEELHQAVIMDEIGWRSPALDEETVNLETFDREGITRILDHLGQSNVDHNHEHPLKVVHSNNPFGSDHMSWLDRHMGAVLTINGDDEAYPVYHTSNDKLSMVSGSLLEKVTKMNAGAVLRMTGIDTEEAQ